MTKWRLLAYYAQGITFVDAISDVFIMDSFAHRMDTQDDYSVFVEEMVRKAGGVPREYKPSSYIISSDKPEWRPPSYRLRVYSRILKWRTDSMGSDAALIAEGRAMEEAAAIILGIRGKLENITCPHKQLLYSEEDQTKFKSAFDDICAAFKEKFSTAKKWDQQKMIVTLYETVSELFDILQQGEASQDDVEKLVARLQMIALKCGLRKSPILEVPTKIIDIQCKNGDFTHLDQNRLSTYPQSLVHAFNGWCKTNPDGRMRFVLFHSDIQIDPPENVIPVQMCFDYDAVYVAPFAQKADGIATLFVNGQQFLGRPIRLENPRPGNFPYRPPMETEADRRWCLERKLKKTTCESCREHIQSILDRKTTELNQVPFASDDGDEIHNIANEVQTIAAPLGHCACASTDTLFLLQARGCCDARIVQARFGKGTVFFSKAGTNDDFSYHEFVLYKGRVFDPYAYVQGLPLNEYLARQFGQITIENMKVLGY